LKISNIFKLREKVLKNI